MVVEVFRRLLGGSCDTAFCLLVPKKSRAAGRALGVSSEGSGFYKEGVGSDEGRELVGGLACDHTFSCDEEVEECLLFRVDRVPLCS